MPISIFPREKRSDFFISYITKKEPESRKATHQCWPDPAFHFDADPDPAVHSDAFSDPDPDLATWSQII